MNKKTSILLIAITSIAFMSSCTMEKRLYMPGYNVEWNKSGNSEEKVNIASNVSSASQEQTTDNNSLSTGNTDNILTEEMLTASVNNSDISISNNKLQKAFTKNILYPIKQKQKINKVHLLKSSDNKYFSNAKSESGGANGFAIASLVLGILGIVLIFAPSIGLVIMSLFASILAIIFGAIGLGKSKGDSHDEGSHGGKGFAIAGLILGLLGLFIWLLAIAIVAGYYY